MTRFWECPTLKPSMNDTYSLHFDAADFWRDTYHQMREIEDAATSDAVIQYLRDQGYTVTRPGDSGVPCARGSDGESVKYEYRWVSVDDLKNPRDLQFVQVYRDFWWNVNEAGDVAFYGPEFRSPSCNKDRRIVERLTPPPGSVGKKKFSCLYVPVDVRGL